MPIQIDAILQFLRENGIPLVLLLSAGLFIQVASVRKIQRLLEELEKLRIARGSALADDEKELIKRSVRSHGVTAGITMLWYVVAVVAIVVMLVDQIVM